ncbi:unnamed protein product [Arabis nemorensis]|uniref:Uncharacterized protein n=1 Tax=Arabis nemorensis TaxID=586526 RepID=A0A565BL44_9BRAS|nr:unnamed protein product [Arabis nemorensis]
MAAKKGSQRSSISSAVVHSEGKPTSRRQRRGNPPNKKMKVKVAKNHVSNMLTV